jgi:membrane-associated phospholipid phosphatase
MVKVNKIKAGNPEYPEDEWIADFWSDDCPTKTFTPAARWIAITNQLIEEKGARLDLAVFAYAKVGMGLNDAGVRCWHEKYRYNVLRPIDYIRQVMAGQEGWNSIMCPTSGNFLTPNFPAYPSGHATFGGVAAEILTDLFGFNYAMTDRCHEGRVEFLSTPRSYKNFYEMAQENAYSRLPIGVHYKMDAEAGVELGYQIGRKINNLPWKK